MILKTLKQTIKIMAQNKFYAFMNLFGISITVAVIMVMWMKTEVNFTANSVESDLDKTLKIHRIKYERKEGLSLSSLGFGIIDKCLSDLETPKYTTLIDTKNWPVVYENRTVKHTAIYTDENFWKIHNFKFIEGRPFNKNEVETNQNVIVISRNIRDSFFGNTKAVGKSMEFQGVDTKVVGVVENVSLTSVNVFAEVWAPYVRKNSSAKSYTGPFTMLLYADSSSDIRKIKDEIDDVKVKLNNSLKADSAKVIFFADNSFDAYYRGQGSFPEKYVEKYEGLGKILGAFLMIILLPVLNLLSLNYTRIRERFEEIGIRKSFGATNRSMRRQLLYENIFVNLIGGVIGLIFAYVTIYLFKYQIFTESVDYEAPIFISFNYSVFIITLLSCIIIGYLSGVVPAIKMSKIEPAKVLKGGEL